MRKLLIPGLFLVLLLTLIFTIPQPAVAADDYLITTGTKRDSTFINRSDGHYRRIYVDTVTFTLGMGDTTINLYTQCGITEGYNFWIRSLNGADDSTFAKFAFSAHRGIWHDDSVARNYDWASVGEESADDYLIAPIAADKIYVRMCKGDSTAGDTLFKWELRFYY